MKKLFAKFRTSKVAKWFTVASLSAMMAVMMCFNCFATDGETSTVDLTSTLSSSFDTMSSNIMGYIGVALPIALTIVGAMLGIKLGIKFFKNVANK